MLKSSLCNYSAYIFVKETIAVVRWGANAVAQVVYRNTNQVIFKQFAPFTDCTGAINNKNVDNAKDFDVVMPMY